MLSIYFGDPHVEINSALSERQLRSKLFLIALAKRCTNVHFLDPGELVLSAGHAKLAKNWEIVLGNRSHLSIAESLLIKLEWQ
jgi:hypothetical protein